MSTKSLNLNFHFYTSIFWDDTEIYRRSCLCPGNFEDIFGAIWFSILNCKLIIWWIEIFIFMMIFQLSKWESAWNFDDLPFQLLVNLISNLSPREHFEQFKKIMNDFPRTSLSSFLFSLLRLMFDLHFHFHSKQRASFYENFSTHCAQLSSLSSRKLSNSTISSLNSTRRDHNIKEERRW